MKRPTATTTTRPRKLIAPRIAVSPHDKDSEPAPPILCAGLSQRDGASFILLVPDLVNSGRWCAFSQECRQNVLEGRNTHEELRSPARRAGNGDSAFRGPSTRGSSRERGGKVSA